LVGQRGQALGGGDRFVGQGNSYARRSAASEEKSVSRLSYRCSDSLQDVHGSGAGSFSGLRRLALQSVLTPKKAPDPLDAPGVIVECRSGQ
jgi:hypothetical protein